MDDEDLVFYRMRAGRKYKTTRLMVVGHSAYSWRERGKLRHPKPDHPTTSLQHHAIENFPDKQEIRPAKSSANKYFATVTRAICGEESPSRATRENAWSEFFYWIYIQGTVGEGARKKPTAKMWRAAKPAFLWCLEKYKPEKVIVTSEAVWGKMPDSDVHLTDMLQAYRLRSGRLVWCLAVPHPSNRRGGFRWEDVASQIAVFRRTRFPTT